MKKTLVLLAVLISVVSFASVILAAEPITPTSLRGGTVINDGQAKANLGKMKIFDVRKKAEYVDGHVAGAISVPYGEKSDKSVNFDAKKDSFDISKFPSDKNEPFIVYCNGPKCWKSYKASVLLIKDGYKKVYWYRNNGFPGWKSKGYPVE
jgi:rhodanese-related sulfurtransferase